MDPVALNHIKETLTITLDVIAIAVGLALMASVVLWVVSAWWALR